MPRRDIRPPVPACLSVCLCVSRNRASRAEQHRPHTHEQLSLPPCLSLPPPRRHSHSSSSSHDARSLHTQPHLVLGSLPKARHEG